MSRRDNWLDDEEDYDDDDESYWGSHWVEGVDCEGGYLPNETDKSVDPKVRKAERHQAKLRRQQRENG